MLLRENFRQTTHCHTHTLETLTHTVTHKHYTNNNKIDDVQLWLEQKKKHQEEEKKMLNKKKRRKSLK